MVIFNAGTMISDYPVAAEFPKLAVAGSEGDGLLLGGGIVGREIYTSGIWLSRLLWVSREADEDDEDDEDDARIGLCGFAPGG
ncbi:hypothetical protein M513_11424 [Trichuris suis]|uniref:Uncharacterized protein n=1 Tax=Trichuris suis TaxID=68888 RepID=A0A085LRU5_9BILA|nr:hypothetical protein M513_11424 [Trichuris suis]